MRRNEDNKLLLIGGGGHGKVVAECIRSDAGNWKIAGFLDPSGVGAGWDGVPVLGDDDCLEQLKEQGIDAAIVSVGMVRDAALRIKLFERLKKIGFRLPVIIHSSAVVSATAKIGEGTVIMAGVIINADAVIGKNCIINSGSIIEHDCRIADHVHVAPAASLSGGVIIDKGCLIGIGATVLQGVRIGEGCQIGAGAVVVNDINSHCVAVGVPAKIVKVV